MSADRELLELAAKAAGVTPQWRDQSLSLYKPGFPDPINWNPLTDDGDALRLAVKLRMQITPGTYLDDAAKAYYSGGIDATEHVHYQQDMLAATRRAIVRAAAEIGRSMP